MRYYVEKRDPDFDAKMARVLCVYKQVQLLREKGQPQGQSVAVLSYDEKPHIQAVGGTGVDRPPVPGQHSAWLRDYEYVRHGLPAATAAGPANPAPVTTATWFSKTKIVSSVPSIFLQVLGTGQDLSDSKKELKQRLEQYLKEINETPVVFRWKYGLESSRRVQNQARIVFLER